MPAEQQTLSFKLLGPLTYHGDPLFHDKVKRAHELHRAWVDLRRLYNKLVDLQVDKAVVDDVYRAMLSARKASKKLMRDTYAR